MSKSKWKQSASSPNLEGTEMGSLVDHLIMLKKHFENELAQEEMKLSYLESKKEALSVQKKKQKKVNTHG